MKTPFVPLIVCVLLVWLAASKLGDSWKEVQAVEKRRIAAQEELNKIKAQHNAVIGNRRALQSSGAEYADFLTAWQKVYATHAPEAISSSFPDIGERFGVFIVDNKREPLKGRSTGESGGTAFRVRAIGPAHGLFRFLGAAEVRYELMAIREINISRNLSDIVVDVSFALPVFNF